MNGNRSRVEPWWTLEDPGHTLISTADDLRDNDETRRVLIKTWDDLYEGRTLFDSRNAAAIEHVVRSGIQAPLLNFARRAVDFVHSRCSAETPSVRAAGHGADWDQYNRAKDLTKFIEGAMDDLEVPTELPRSLLSALNTGTGCVKVVVRGCRIELEVTSPRELFVDPDDGRHGKPRCLYQIKPVDRRSIVSEFPEYEDAIMSAGSTDDTYTVADSYNQTTDSDAVDLYEGWYLPCGREDSEHYQPGRHVVCIQGQVLLDEEWTVPRFPISFLRPSDPAPGTGFWGQGLMERLDGAQFEIDELIRHVGESIRHSNLKVFVSDQADIPTDLISDPTVGTIIPYAGAQVPVFHVPPTVARETIEHLGQLIDWLYSIAGMSEQASTGGVPAAIGSGRAQLFYHQFQSQNYVDLIKRYGQHVVDVIERVLDAAKALSEEEPGWKVRYAKGSVIREIEWSEVDMDRDDYVIELEEVSPVPATFAGRLQQIEQDAAEGRIPPEYLARLREDPDGWWVARRTARADVDFVEHVIDQLLDPTAPMPRVIEQMNWNMMVNALRTEILNGIVAGRDPDVIARLQEYSHQVVAAMPKPKAPEPPAGPPMPPQGMPPQQ